jgi:sec-independent protein translocase protein TatA
MGPLEIGIILVIILIVFGVGKLPQVGDALGRGIRSFRKAQSGDDEKDEKKSEAPSEQPAATAVTEEKPKAEANTEAKVEPKGGDTGGA